MTSVYLCSGDGAKFAVPKWVASHSRTVEVMLADLPSNFTQLHFPELTAAGLENVRPPLREPTCPAPSAFCVLSAACWCADILLTYVLLSRVL